MLRVDDNILKVQFNKQHLRDNKKSEDVNKENSQKLWKIIQEAGDYLGC